MRAARFVPSGLLTTTVALALTVGATHMDPCVVTSADPASYLTIDAPNGRRYYVEERGNPLGAPVPLSGYLLGDGTTWYEESNDIFGLQRGAFGGIIADWFPPGCDQTWWDEFDPENPNLPSGTGPCLYLLGADPFDDETCHAGPDHEIYGLFPGFPFQPPETP